ncbi:MAG: NHLP leader peptide family RiPP precursor [Lapillicoccus sp.]
MSDSSTSDRHEVASRLVARAASDAAFRRQLVDDPRAAVKDELGVTLPAGVSVTVLQESADRLYLVLPAAENTSSDLSDAELSSVAGGTWDDSNSGWTQVNYYSCDSHDEGCGP